MCEDDSSLWVFYSVYVIIITGFVSVPLTYCFHFFAKLSPSVSLLAHSSFPHSSSLDFFMFFPLSISVFSTLITSFGGVSFPLFLPFHSSASCFSPYSLSLVLFFNLSTQLAVHPQREISCMDEPVMCAVTKTFSVGSF